MYCEVLLLQYYGYYCQNAEKVLAARIILSSGAAAFLPLSLNNSNVEYFKRTIELTTAF